LKRRLFCRYVSRSGCARHDPAGTAGPTTAAPCSAYPLMWVGLCLRLFGRHSRPYDCRTVFGIPLMWVGLCPRLFGRHSRPYDCRTMFGIPPYVGRAVPEFIRPAQPALRCFCMSRRVRYFPSCMSDRVRHTPHVGRAVPEIIRPAQPALRCFCMSRRVRYFPSCMSHHVRHTPLCGSGCA